MGGIASEVAVGVVEVGEPGSVRSMYAKRSIEGGLGVVRGRRGDELGVKCECVATWKPVDRCDLERVEQSSSLRGELGPCQREQSK